VGSGDVQVLQHGPRVDGHDLYSECQCRFDKKAVILTLMMGSIEGGLQSCQIGGMSSGFSVVYLNFWPCCFFEVSCDY
jgi:hypothetical protein